MSKREIVEVVLCKDCKYLKEKILIAGEIGGYCEMHQHTLVFGHDFCSYGKESTGKIAVDGEVVRY